MYLSERNRTECFYDPWVGKAFFFLTYGVNSLYTNECTVGSDYIQLYLFFSMMSVVECSKSQAGGRHWKNSETTKRQHTEEEE